MKAGIKDMIVNPCLGYVNGRKTEFSDREADRMFPEYFRYVVKYMIEGNSLGEAHTLACCKVCYEAFLKFPEEEELENLLTDTARKYELFHRVTMKAWNDLFMGEGRADFEKIFH